MASVAAAAGAAGAANIASGLLNFACQNKQIKAQKEAELRARMIAARQAKIARGDVEAGAAEAGDFLAQGGGTLAELALQGQLARQGVGEAFDTSLSSLRSLVGTDALSSVELSPGFQFRREQGEQAINRANAARGGRGGGAALKELLRFNQDLASTEFEGAFQRSLANRQQQSGFAGQLAGLGLQQGAFDFGVADTIAKGEFGQQARQAGLATGTANQLANIALSQNLTGFGVPNAGGPFNALSQGLVGGADSFLTGALQGGFANAGSNPFAGIRPAPPARSSISGGTGPLTVVG